MSEEKQVPSGDEEAKKITPEKNSAEEAKETQAETPQPEPNEPSLEAVPVAETQEVQAKPTEPDTQPEQSSEQPTAPTEESTDSPVSETSEIEEPAQAVEEGHPAQASAKEPSEEAETSTTPEEEKTETGEPAAATSPTIEAGTSEEITTASQDKLVAEEPKAAAQTENTEEQKEESESPVAETTASTEDESERVEPGVIETTPDAEEPKAAALTENTEEPKEEATSPLAEAAVEASAAINEDAESPATSGQEASETIETTTAKTEPDNEATVPTPSEEAIPKADHTTEVQEPEEEIDYTTYSRDQLAEVVDELSKQDNFKRSDAILSKVLPLFKAMARARRKEALEKFIAEGGAEDDFEFRHDEVFNRFDASVRLIRDRRASFFKEREARKEDNYKKKLEVLDKLRELIDGENATTNLSPIKSLQEEWKAIGPVPAQHNRTLWANYNALLDRFYNNRHILFELKELDRKKNLVKKTELCEKAEALDKLENIKDAIIQLNELHDEYKKIGAVPRDVQESLWQRFKSASDAIYKKRKSYLEDLKGELMQNLEKKRALAEELKPYLTFNSDRINDWNAKTKEILAIQKRWDALGGLPREHAKEVNKAFWSGFKGFFSRKNAFFKKLEGMRHENLEKKQELVAKAKEFSESKDWDRTSEALKGLQRQWKEIGPVPEKFRNSVYAEFKEACDAFFNNRRASQDQAEAQFVENQKHKEALIKEVQDRATKGDGEPSELDDIMVRWNAIGFVPRSAIRTIEDKFSKAVDAFVKSLDVADEEREALVMKAELSSLKKGPNSDRRLNRKESDLRRKVQEVEDNIALWNNNLAFFANSKGADKLREEYDQKIADAEEELVQLKKQLRMVRSM